MAKFHNIDFLGMGKWLYAILADPEKMQAFKNLSSTDQKKQLGQFMEPLNKTWDQLTVIFHYDEENTVHVSIPYREDVQKTANDIINDVEPPYEFPPFYEPNPKTMFSPYDRLQSYIQRLGDYVMTRCK